MPLPRREGSSMYKCIRKLSLIVRVSMSQQLNISLPSLRGRGKGVGLLV